MAQGKKDEHHLEQYFVIKEVKLLNHNFSLSTYWINYQIRDGRWDDIIECRGNVTERKWAGWNILIQRKYNKRINICITVRKEEIKLNNQRSNV